LDKDKKYKSKDVDIQKLVDIMERLRAPNGCPWDREQDHTSLKRFLIEEAYEVIEAIESKDFEHLKEELGDLLLQVIFHARVAEEAGLFDIQDVIDGIHKKLVHRHPHVFSDVFVDTAKGVEVQWEQIKIDEKKGVMQERSIIDGVPLAMPATLQAVRLTEKAARVGFDWKNSNDVMAKIDEEWNELKEAMTGKSEKEIKHELGDIMFALCNLARHLNVDPEEVQRQSMDRFRARFKMMEKIAADRGKKLKEYNLDEQELLWQEAKKILD
jgi:tetrapyrrole methylase family protein / MazG family protein